MKRKLSTALVAALLSLSAWTQAKPAEKAPAAPPPPPPKIRVGDMAPDFKLLDQNANVVALSDFKGKKNVALAFYVFAFTGG